MKKLKIIFGLNRQIEPIAVGSKVLFNALNEKVCGIVKKIEGTKALIESFYLNSVMCQWIDMKNLLVIP